MTHLLNTKLNIKPLSVNDAWQGKRFKTPAYKKYEKDVLLLLPKKKLDNPPYKVELEFGFSNPLSDIDNPIKLLLDIVQKKYSINDKDIYQLNVLKSKTKKGEEFILLNICSFVI